MILVTKTSDVCMCVCVGKLSHPTSNRGLHLFARCVKTLHSPRVTVFPSKHRQCRRRRSSRHHLERCRPHALTVRRIESPLHSPQRQQPLARRPTILLRAARNVFVTSPSTYSTTPCDHEPFATPKWWTIPNRDDTIYIICPLKCVPPSVVNALGTPNEAHHFSTECAAASIEHDTPSSRQTNRLTSSTNTSKCL